MLNTLQSLTRDPSNEYVAEEINLFSDAQKRAFSTERSALYVLAALALSALLLSATGIWYTTRQYVRQSRKELSIRLALGATPRSLLALTLRRSLTLVALGLALGSLLSFVTARWLQTALKGVSDTDPFPYLLMAATLFLISLAASYLPARAAVKTNPQDSLTEI